MTTLVNLAKVFEEVGMNERTAKSQATRCYNKAEVEAVDGLVSVEDFLKATAQYEDENNTSKYKAGVLAARAEVKAGKIKADWQEKTEVTAKANPFDDTKVLKALLKLKPELVEVVGKIRAEIEAAKAE